MYPDFACGEKAACRRMIMCLLCKEGENTLTFVSICGENYEAQFPFLKCGSWASLIHCEGQHSAF